MIIGNRFAWGHIPKTGGDATLEFFRVFPELITHADSTDTNVKHELFHAREKEVAGKLLVLNIRRLPSWILSYEHHRARSGVYPDYKPIPMASSDAMAESDLPDKMIKWFTNYGTITIDRWLRTEYLYYDLLNLVSELTQITQQQLRKVAELQMVNAMHYTHNIAEWFTKEQVEKMYCKNPLWSSIEQEVYDSELSLELASDRLSLTIENLPFGAHESEGADQNILRVLRSISEGAVDEHAETSKYSMHDGQALQLLNRREDFTNVELTRGYIETAHCTHNQLLVRGWMLLPNVQFDAIRVFVNGDFVGSAEIASRQDIASAFPRISHAKWSGFYLRRPIAQNIKLGHIDLLGYKDGRPIGRTSTIFRNDLDTVVPTPPPELTTKAAFTEDAHLFKMGGLKAYSDILDVIARHHDPNALNRILDLGCGCGRVTVHFLLLHDNLEVFGCDIDLASIEWCVKHFQSGEFKRVEPVPPTPYSEEAFDLVICHSVLTNLARDAQSAWMAEMRRIVAPGGLVLASVYGASFASFQYPELFPSTPHDTAFYGLFAEGRSSSLGGLVPAEYYYRHVIQSREYTTKEWSKYFEIIEYVERGVEDCHDAVLMRRLA